jgi:hypothetical protein
MLSKKPVIDIVNVVLEDCIIAFPVSSFIISLYKQYQQRGSLSKKQLIGLHSKASSIKDIQPAKLATLEALIKKMPNRYKSELPTKNDEPEPVNPAEDLIRIILSRYPEHKRVLFLKSKFDKDGVLSPAEIADLQRLKVVLKIN